MVLVDEFQDTDPVQWRILREAFHGHRTLVLIGDPKQAIYGFRGADVHAYLRGREPPARRCDAADELAQRRRAARGPGLRVFRGAALGDPRIRVLPVAAHHRSRLVDVAGTGAAAGAAPGGTWR